MLACFLVMMLAGSQVAAVSPVQVLSSDDSGIRFSVTGLEPTWQDHVYRDRELVLYEARFPGFVSQSGPGEPMLPRHGGWVIVPPGSWPEIVVHEEQWVTSEPRRLMVTPTPVMFEEPETGEPILGAELLLPGETVSQGILVDDGSRSRDNSEQAKAAGGAAVTLGKVQIWRGRRIVSYQVTPLRVDEAGQVSQYLRSGTWEIRFGTEKRNSDGHDTQFRFEKETRRGDASFGSIFLNGDKLNRWRTEAGAGSAVPSTTGASAVTESTRSAQKRGSLLAPEVRMIVGRTRLHRVMASELRDDNLFPGATIQEDQVRVYQRRYLESLQVAGTTPPYVEVEVPIHMVGDGDVFDGDDFFLFYGLLPRDDGSFIADFGSGPVDIPDCGDTPENYNGRNVYWLAASEPDLGESWSRMEVATLEPASGLARSSYRRVDRYEENNSFCDRSELASVSGAPIDPEYHDRNYWNSLNDQDVLSRIRLYAPDFSADDVTLRVSCVGASNSNTNRWVEVYFNNGSVDSLLTTLNVNTLQRVNYTTTLIGDLLTDGDVIVHLERPGGTADMWSYLDWVELEYNGRYSARDDTLLFHCGDETTDQDIEVTGYRTGDLGLVEISDPRQPVWIELGPANIVDAGGSYSLSLHVPQPNGRRTFYSDSEMTGDGVAEIVYYRSELASGDDPLAVVDPPDLIVVTHAEFEQTINRWVEHRRAFAGGDLSVHIVDVGDLYDTFSGGLVSPWAIKRFATHAMNEWGSWALQIVGDANENARGLGSPNSSDLYYNEPTDWVPTRLHVQFIGGYPPEYMASDKWFVTSDPVLLDKAYPEWPDDYGAPADMYVGRFPCNTVTELNRMIDKVIVYENVQPGQQWRRRGVFFADDAWSYASGSVVADTCEWKGSELAFENSEETMATWWESLADIGLTTTRYFLSDYLDPYLEPGQRKRHTVTFRDHYRNGANEPWDSLIDVLSAGALIVHYQGHANAKLLAHEYVLWDEPYNKRDVSVLANAGKPWVFYGMGCHVSDWAQNTIKSNKVVEPSIGEKLLLRNNSGSVATYGSCGYEYLTYNSLFSELQLSRYVFDPPTTTVTGDEIRSRWMLGELCWASEADLVAISTDVRYRRMVAQYSVLGDALMNLNCGAPVVTTRLADASRDTNWLLWTRPIPGPCRSLRPTKPVPG